MKGVAEAMEIFSWSWLLLLSFGIALLVWAAFLRRDKLSMIPLGKSRQDNSQREGKISMIAAWLSRILRD